MRRSWRRSCIEAILYSGAFLGCLRNICRSSGSRFCFVERSDSFHFLLELLRLLDFADGVFLLACDGALVLLDRYADVAQMLSLAPRTRSSSEMRSANICAYPASESALFLIVTSSDSSEEDLCCSCLKCSSK